MQVHGGREGPNVLLACLLAFALLVLLPACHGRPLRTQFAPGPRARTTFDSESAGQGILRRPVLANEAKPYQRELKQKHLDDITKAKALRASAHQPAPNHLGWGNHWLDSERKKWDAGPNGFGKCTAPGGVSIDLCRLYQFLKSGK